MAKIKAKIGKGTTKEVMRWVRHVESDGLMCSTTLVLRDDGVLLEKASYRRPGEPSWSSGYRIVARNIKSPLELDRKLRAIGYLREGKDISLGR